MSTANLPTVNAILNAITAILLLAGLMAIQSGRRELHQRLMTSALATSILFFASYLTYHALHGSKPFLHQGPMRTFYFVILISHVVLATLNLPMIITTVIRAYRGQFERHKKIARFTWLVWMYVSLTGVLVYWMLYRWFPAMA